MQAKNLHFLWNQNDNQLIRSYNIEFKVKNVVFDSYPTNQYFIKTSHCLTEFFIYSVLLFKYYLISYIELENFSSPKYFLYYIQWEEHRIEKLKEWEDKYKTRLMSLFLR